MLIAAWAAHSVTSPPRPRRKLRLEIPRRRGKSEAIRWMALGPAIVAMMKAPQSSGDPPGSSQLAASVSDRGRRHDAAAEVVAHLPPAERRDPAAPASLRVAGDPEDPRQELPVPARPPVLPRSRDFVVAGEAFEELDVRHEPGAGEDTFEQVVAREGSFPAHDPRGPSRTSPLRRAPCPCRCPLRKGPDRRRRRRRRTGRSPAARRRSAGGGSRAREMEESS